MVRLSENQTPILLSYIILGNNGEAVSVLLFFIGAGLSTDAENVA